MFTPAFHKAFSCDALVIDGESHAVPLLLDADAPEAEVVDAVLDLRLVYHSLGRAYRRHRDQTGEPVTPALKAAAKAFKQDPTVLSLAPVAAYLDQMGLLTW